MADISAANPEDHIFRDIGCVISDTFQIAGDEKRVQRLLRDVRVLVHAIDKRDVNLVVHSVHDIVHLEDGLGEVRVAGDEGFECAANHSSGGGCHAGNIHGQINVGKSDEF